MKNNLQNYLYQNLSWQDTSKLLKRFNPSTDWIDLNQSFIKSFRLWLLTDAKKKDGSNYSVNTFIQHYKIIRTTINSAMNDGVKDANTKCFGLRYFKEETQHIYLTKSEITKLENVRLVGRMDIARKRFLIGAYSGARYSDFKALSFENIQTDTLRYMSQKTGKRITVPVHRYVSSALRYGIPELDGLRDSSEMVIFDKLIKQCCKKAGINSLVYVSSKRNGIVESIKKEKWELVSSHTARRSFATNLSLSGALTRDIQAMLGHSSILTTEKYILSDNNANLEEVRRLEFFQDR